MTNCNHWHCYSKRTIRIKRTQPSDNALSESLHICVHCKSVRVPPKAPNRVVDLETTIAPNFQIVNCNGLRLCVCANMNNVHGLRSECLLHNFTGADTTALLCSSHLDLDTCLVHMQFEHLLATSEWAYVQCAVCTLRVWQMANGSDCCLLPI